MREWTKGPAVLAATALIVGLAGCGPAKTADTGTESNADAESSAKPAEPEFDASDPKRAVKGFLEAQGRGDVTLALRYMDDGAEDADEYPPSDTLAKAFKSGLTDIKIGESSYDDDGDVTVPYTARLDGEARKGEATVKASPEGGYRIDDIDDDLLHFGPAPACGVDEQTLAVVGTYRLDCEWNGLAVEWSANPQDSAKDEYTVKVGDRSAFDKALTHVFDSTVKAGYVYARHGGGADAGGLSYYPMDKETAELDDEELARTAPGVAADSFTAMDTAVGRGVDSRSYLAIKGYGSYTMDGAAHTLGSKDSPLVFLLDPQALLAGKPAYLNPLDSIGAGDPLPAGEALSRYSTVGVQLRLDADGTACARMGAALTTGPLPECRA